MQKFFFYGKIILLKDAEITTASTIPNTKNIEFDFNGHTLTSTQALTNQGTLSMTDSIGTGSFVTTKTNALFNQGNITLDNISIKANGSIVNGNAGTGTITLQNNPTLDGTIGVYVTTGQTINVLNATINASNSGIYLQSANSKLTIEDGIIQGVSNGIYTCGENNIVTINNGDIKEKQPKPYTTEGVRFRL